MLALTLTLLASLPIPAADPLPEGAVARLLATPAPKHTLNALGLSADGKTIATWSTNHVLRLWDAETGKERRAHTLTEPEGKAKVSTHYAAFSADGALLAFGCEDQTIRIWDVAAGKERQVLHFRRDGAYGAPRCLAFAPDGKTLVSYSRNDGCLRLWDVAAGDELSPLALPESETDCYNLAFAPDRRTLIAATVAESSGRMEARIALWDLATGRHQRSFVVPRDVAPHPRLTLSVSPDSRSLAVGRYGGTVFLFESLTGKERARFSAHVFGNGLAFGPSGRFLAIADVGRVRLWDLRGGKEIRQLCGCGGWIELLDFSRDGRRLVSGSTEGEVVVWDLERLIPSDE